MEATTITKPLPENCKQLFVKTTGECLDCFHYKSKFDPLKKYYTFLVISETGTGKTTLLDAFVNYLANMSFHDKWRWKLADESSERHTFL